MAPTESPPTDRLPLSRRRFAALGLGVGTTLLAGCTADSVDGLGGDGTAGGSATAGQGTFRLLISDQPVAIDDFDSLEVSFREARVFGGPRTGDDDDVDEDDDEVEAEAETSTPTASPEGTATPGTDTPTATEEPTDTATPEPGSEEEEGPEGEEEQEVEEEEEDDGDGDDGEGFRIIPLDGATVDLTQVTGDRAMSVFEGPLPEGRYTKIELFAMDVGGVVDGEDVDVTIPPGKLMITKNFEVEAGETLSFVFDIGVVKKGPGGYNLLPVISESGVAGRDVPVEEVGSAAEGPSAAGDGTGEEDEGEVEDEGTDDGPDGQGGGPPDDAGP